MLRCLTLTFFLFGSATNSILAQACCSGGVPVSSNLGLPAASANVLQLSLTYDLNALNTLKTETQREDSQERKRITQSTLLEVGYSFNDKFSADAFFSFVQQDRLIKRSNDLARTRGVGDAVLLLKYNFFSNLDQTTSFSMGVGIKFPLGATDKFSDNSPIQPSLDLQPGSGAWDGLLWGQFSHALHFRPSLSFVSTSIYSYRGKFNDYLCQVGQCNTYQFGQEFQLMAGLADRVAIAKYLLDPSLTFRYRTVTTDSFNDNPRPGTGGDFGFVAGGLAFWLSPTFSANVNLEVPFYARVTDTQVSPTYRFTVGIYKRIGFSENTSSILSKL